MKAGMHKFPGGYGMKKYDLWRDDELCRAAATGNAGAKRELRQRQTWRIRLEAQMDGLFEKFTITRNEGQPPFRGEHFVLKPPYDKHARMAMLAYADSCETELPGLAKDIREWIGSISNR